MEKNIEKILIIFILIILLPIFFCGCQESDDSQGDSNEVELINYSIATETSQWGDKYKVISGLVKNIAGKKLNSIEVIVKFYDINNSLLTTKSDIISDIPNTNTKEFSISYYSSNSFYNEVDWNKIRFDFSIS